MVRKDATMVDSLLVEFIDGESRHAGIAEPKDFLLNIVLGYDERPQRLPQQNTNCEESLRISKRKRKEI